MDHIERLSVDRRIELEMPGATGQGQGLEPDQNPGAHAASAGPGVDLDRADLQGRQHE